MMVPLSIGLLTAGAVYLILQRGMIRIIFGFVMLSNAINLLIVSTGGTYNRDEPLVANSELANVADPLPQAFVLTAIVISFAVTIFLLTLAAVYPNDDTNHGTEKMSESLVKEKKK